MNPFGSYPKCGEVGPRPFRGMTTCRTGYGAKLQKLTGQTTCAYCGVSLVDTYEHWLLTAVDHVIPRSSIPKAEREAWRRWVDSLHNVVLCCSGCNGFLNRSPVPLPAQVPCSFEEFCRIRDEAFEVRLKRVQPRLCQERATYRSKPWEPKGEQGGE